MKSVYLNRADLDSGWRVCASNSSLSSNLTYCGYDPNPEIPLPGLNWTGAHINLWNRTATEIISTHSGDIKQITALGEHRAISIQPDDFFTALNLLLWPSSKNQTDSENARGLQWLMTTFLGTSLDLSLPSLSTSIGETRAMEQFLVNTVTMPLYLFHSLLLGTDAAIGTDPEVPQTGLGEAFYVKASYAYSSTRATPDHWTVIAYTATGAALIGILLVGQIFAMRHPSDNKSAFALLDLSTSLKVVTGKYTEVSAARDATEEPLADALQNERSKKGVLKRTSKLSVTARAT